MCIVGCNSNEGGAAAAAPAAGDGAGSGRDAGSACVECCAVFSIQSETVLAVPAPRSRAKLGIGERVRLQTVPPTDVTWTLVDDDPHHAKGQLDTAGGHETTYTAGPRAHGVTIKAERSC